MGIRSLVGKVKDEAMFRNGVRGAALRKAHAG